MKKPNIPKSFRRANGAMGFYSMLHGVLIWLGASGIARLVYQQDAWPPLVRVPLTVLLLILAGMGMFLLGSLGHEGFHGNLHSRRDVSMVMGIVASTAVPSFCSVGLNVYHWRHHAHTNTQNDPDFLLYRDRKSFVSKSIGPVLTSAYCMRNTFRLLAGTDALEGRFPFTVREMKSYAYFNVALVMAVSAFWVWLGLDNIKAFSFTLLFPALVGQMYWTLHPYIEHAGTGNDIRNNARDCTSPALRFLLLGYTYHHCHHLYPNVPAYRLPALRRYLEKMGYLNSKTPVQTSLLGALWTGVVGTLESRQ